MKWLLAIALNLHLGVGLVDVFEAGPDEWMRMCVYDFLFVMAIWSIVITALSTWLVLRRIRTGDFFPQRSPICTNPMKGI